METGAIKRHITRDRADNPTEKWSIDPTSAFGLRSEIGSLLLASKNGPLHAELRGTTGQRCQR